MLSFDFSIGDYLGSESGSGTNFVRLSNDAFVPPVDQFTVRAAALGDPVNGLSPTLVQFGMFSFDASIVSSDSFPTASEINAFAPVFFPFDSLNFLTFGSQRVDWRLTSFVATPEPAPAGLVTLALLLLSAHHSMSNTTRSIAPSNAKGARR